jgi:hypothetical protein
MVLLNPHWDYTRNKKMKTRTYFFDFWSSAAPTRISGCSYKALDGHSYKNQTPVLRLHAACQSIGGCINYTLSYSEVSTDVPDSRAPSGMLCSSNRIVFSWDAARLCLLCLGRPPRLRGSPASMEFSGITDIRECRLYTLELVTFALIGDLLVLMA